MKSAARLAKEECSTFLFSNSYGENGTMVVWSFKNALSHSSALFRFTPIRSPNALQNGGG